MTLPEFLKTERLKHSLTQAEMAQKLDISYSHYKAVETGKKNAGVTLRYKIAKFTHKSTTYVYKLTTKEE